MFALGTQAVHASVFPAFVFSSPERTDFFAVMLFPSSEVILKPASVQDSFQTVGKSPTSVCVCVHVCVCVNNSVGEKV